MIATTTDSSLQHLARRLAAESADLAELLPLADLDRGSAAQIQARLYRALEEVAAAGELLAQADPRGGAQGV